jgi:uracil-DNA glycosylase family 4
VRILTPAPPPAYTKPASCSTCLGGGWPDQGFMPSADGSGRNGVLLVGEALGEAEAWKGRPFQGKAGLALAQMFQRVGLNREDFLIDNVIRCRPPDNKLNGEVYEQEVVFKCRPHLDGSLGDSRVRAVVPMGEVAFQRVCGLDKKWKITPSRGYVWRSEGGKWALPTFHPAFIMRGNHKLSGVFLNDLLRAVKVAKEGFTPHRLVALLDPSPLVAEAFAASYEAHLVGGEPSPLAYDIETPMKAEGLDEGELAVDDPSYIILRVGIAFREGEALSVPFTLPYMNVIRRLLGSPGPKVVWNASYDRPRLEANGVPVEGPEWDMMWGWHVLNSDLPKGLAFVAPFYCHDQMAWKHLSNVEPARYNAIDAEVEWRLGVGIKGDLEKHGLWEVFDRHVVQLSDVLHGMSRAGLPVSQERRAGLSLELQTELGVIDREIQGVVPPEARQRQLYKVAPKDAATRADFIKVPALCEWEVCSVCGLEKPPKAHFRKLKKKVNPCAEGVKVRKTGAREVWAKLLPWKPSVKQLTLYARVRGHRLQQVYDKVRRVRRVTFDDDALEALQRKYPDDPLYPKVQDRREVEKLLTTYTGVWNAGERTWSGGMPVGADGLVHTTFTNNPSTLRLSSAAPNLTNIPRAGKGWGGRIKEIFVAPEGFTFVEADFRAIEAQLVGYGAGSRDYLRLAKLGVHDYLNSHLLTSQGKIGKPADLAWSDEDLKTCFAELKARFKEERDTSKTIVHASNYGQLPDSIYKKHMDDFPEGPAQAARLQKLYFEVCPDVPRWQKKVVKQAEEEGFLRNPFGYLHRFWRVLEWTKNREGEWQSEWGEDARRALAFGPQSTASGILKEAILRIKIESEAVLRGLRVAIHDSLLSLFPLPDAERLGREMMRLMAQPCPFLPLPEEWGMGTHLTIEVEGKIGPVWATMTDLR